MPYSFLSLKSRADFSPRGDNNKNFAALAAIRTPRRAHASRRDSVPALGLGRNALASLAHPPILPHNRRGAIGSIRLSKRRWHHGRSPRRSTHTARSSGTRALRFVASAHIPTGKLQWKRRLVSARNPVTHLHRMKIYCGTATHYGQARYNSRNLLSVATNSRPVNRIWGQKIC